MTQQAEDASVTQAERVGALLASMRQRIPAVTGALVATDDGLVVASSLPAGEEPDRVAAMVAAALPLAEQLAAELSRGTIDEVRAIATGGIVHIRSAGRGYVLAVATDHRPSSPLLEASIGRIAGALAGLLEVS